MYSTIVSFEACVFLESWSGNSHDKLIGTKRRSRHWAFLSCSRSSGKHENKRILTWSMFTCHSLQKWSEEAGWLVRWLVGWFVGWLVGWLVMIWASKPWSRLPRVLPRVLLSTSSWNLQRWRLIHWSDENWEDFCTIFAPFLSIFHQESMASEVQKRCTWVHFISFHDGFMHWWMLPHGPVALSSFCIHSSSMSLLEIVGLSPSPCGPQKTTTNRYRNS